MISASHLDCDSAVRANKNIKVGVTTRKPNAASNHNRTAGLRTRRGTDRDLFTFRNFLGAGAEPRGPIQDSRFSSSWRSDRWRMGGRVSTRALLRIAKTTPAPNQTRPRTTTGPRGSAPAVVRGPNKPRPSREGTRVYEILARLQRFFDLFCPKCSLRKPTPVA